MLHLGLIPFLLSFPFLLLLPNHTFRDTPITRYLPLFLIANAEPDTSPRKPVLETSKP